MKASQSDAWVGNKPIDWHLYNAKIILTKLPTKKINFWPHACVPSIVLNAIKKKKNNVHTYSISYKIQLKQIITLYKILEELKYHLF